MAHLKLHCPSTYSNGFNNDDTEGQKGGIISEHFGQSLGKTFYEL